MPSSRTPRAPSRQIARPQFAPTPRFLFSQRAASQLKEPGNNDSILPEDKTDILPNPCPTPTPARGSASRRKEVIEDSGSDLDLERNFNQSENGVGHLHEDIPSSPPPKMTEVGEGEELFGPTVRRSKRRRVSVSVSATLATPETRKRRPYDAIETSPPEPSPYGPTFVTNSALNHEPPSPSLPYRTTPQSLRTPRPKPPAPGPAPTTPATAKPPFRSYPRFFVSSASQPPVKPTFILPHSPSPDQSGGPGPSAIPTPFSPSSHALRRRGHQRSSAPSYLPGGMASEVRSWVLEMGAKHEQQTQMQMQTASGLRRTSAGVSLVDPSRYSYMLRISDVRQSALGSCGPLAFIRGQAVAAASVFSGDTIRETGVETDKAGNDMRNVLLVLLMGVPRLRAGELRPPSRVPSLQEGDVVGILRGLVWEIPAGKSEMGSVPLPAEPEHERILRGESELFLGSRLERWLVGMEWEVISSA
ncbi:hypothetical protein BDV10DRAFT_2534 [Aspergillus recurvatus]